MASDLRILHLEDDPLDSELVRELLAADGLAARLDRVDTLAAFDEALRTGAYALVLSDYSLPGMDAMEALGLARRLCPETPFIFLSGVLGEERAIETLKLGASDYVLKSHMGRLVSAVRRALQEAQTQSRRKQAEEALRRERDFAERLIDTAQAIVLVLDPEGRIVRFNRFMETLSGYRLEEVQGKDWFTAFLSERDRVRIKEVFARALSGAATRGNINPIVTRSGEERDIEWWATPLTDAEGQGLGVLAIGQDITERVRAESALKESEERFRRAITHAPFPIMLHAEDGEVIQVNTSWTELTGYTPDEIRSVSAWVERAYGERKDAVMADIARLYSLDTPIDEGEYVITTKTGEPRTWHFRSSPLGRLPDQRSLVVSMALDITERKQMEETIKHQAYHDPLTGLPNRKLFLDILALKLAESRRNRGTFAVLFLDLDRFKYINDSLGHEAGDRLLKGVAEGLRGSVRASDVVARFGGDEFNILLTDVAQTEDISKVAQKIVERFQSPYRIDGYELHTGISIGISVYPDDGDDIDALVRNADIAMYQAKALGGSTYRFFSPTMNVLARERMRLETALCRSIERGELAVYYQPRVLIGSPQVVRAEALVRWQHPERGLLSAAEFVPLAEEVGFITEIDEWVLRTTCAQLRAWREAGLPPLCIAVNLSALVFHRADLAGSLARVIEETGLDPRCIEIEITERTAMRDIERTVEHLSRLAGLGVEISIDDFGTGYSSLSYLKNLPVQKLKIGKAFIHDIPTDPDDRSIIRAVVALAHNMNIKVVAEGVETEAQLAFLREVGCHELQGHLISAALPPEEFEALVWASRP